MYPAAPLQDPAKAFAHHLFMRVSSPNLASLKRAERDPQPGLALVTEIAAVFYLMESSVAPLKLTDEPYGNLQQPTLAWKK